MWFIIVLSRKINFKKHSLTFITQRHTFIQHNKTMYSVLYFFRRHMFTFVLKGNVYDEYNIQFEHVDIFVIILVISKNKEYINEDL